LIATPSPFHFTWLIWASAFLLPWAFLFVARPDLRRPMLWASGLTAPFGLTEPLFVPRYWNPRSLFDLAQRTGFDIESLIFCFALGGLGIAAYRAFAKVPSRLMDRDARHSPRHRWHLLALASPVAVFAGLVMLPWNPIYPSILAVLAGALATLFCRPDLWRNTLVGGAVFLLLYAAFLLGLKWIWPGYIATVWNLPDLLPWLPWGLPVEELLFGFAFGTYWSGAYEHLTWREHAGARTERVPTPGALIHE
jgi:hypothetical protein